MGGMGVGVVRARAAWRRRRPALPVMAVYVVSSEQPAVVDGSGAGRVGGSTGAVVWDAVVAGTTLGSGGVATGCGVATLGDGTASSGGEIAAKPGGGSGMLGGTSASGVGTGVLGAVA